MSNTPATTTLPTIAPGRGLLIAGPQGSGKTRLAELVAKHRGGLYRQIDVADLNQKRMNDWWLDCRTLIVEGAPTTAHALAHLKRLATGNDLPVLTLSRERVHIEPPAVIVCAEAPVDELARHFDVVQLEPAAA